MLAKNDYICLIIWKQHVGSLGITSLEVHETDDHKVCVRDGREGNRVSNACNCLCVGEPDKELNPKKKVWEQVQPDLRTDEQCVAKYKGAAFEVAGKGVCKAQTMSNSGIK